MDNFVVIKGNKNGIVVILKSGVDFEVIKDEVAKKFADSAKFLGNCKTAVSFEGRDLSQDEALTLLDVIKANSNLDVVCLLENDAERSKSFEEAVNRKLVDNSVNYARFHKGNLRSGQILESENSVIILGDVNPGASVISEGNIVVMGSLKGTAIAGRSGNANAFVIALDMSPMQIRISDVIARSPDSPARKTENTNKIAFLEDDTIFIEPLSKSIFNEIKLN